MSLSRRNACSSCLRNCRKIGFHPTHTPLLFVKMSRKPLWRCKLHLQRISWKNRDKKSLCCQQDENMPSVSELYGVPILEISTAHKDIVDGNLVFEGHLLDVPSPVITYAQVVGNGLELSCRKQFKAWDFVAENGIRSL